MQPDSFKSKCTKCFKSIKHRYASAIDSDDSVDSDNDMVSGRLFFAAFRIKMHDKLKFLKNENLVRNSLFFNANFFLSLLSTMC